MMHVTYVDMLAALAIDSAHPGGEAMTEEMIAHEAFEKSHRLLDIGCGTGKTAYRLAKALNSQIDAVDNHPNMVMKASKQLEAFSNVTVHQASIEHLPFPNAVFDGIISESVFAFCDTKKAFKECYRTLKSGGTLYLNEMCLIHPVEPADYEEIQTFYTLSGIRTVNEWIDEVIQAGFVNTELIEAKEIAMAANKTPYEVQLTPNIDLHYLDLLDEHEKLVKKYKNHLGYIVIRCLKV
ncbi:class I SAM-dependent methyltransferase [Salipaludibacillus agaradhaerens]|uniref:class I SAM-dependent methyltransferase n=1 Tax=Salipaludibacillus agaradhaerens TaxID=76935 RepID=UPI0021511BE8|nr:class I SAM-dependent methyltransferase [Salipaludibacillus agaradhaerens]MCR6106719.1 class I SAM-dependent methyltransferase [Salipaludibacillus agaradhaerens]MCR6118752.1 class I SAM-dependent methyltransferase [Salipaludibacillus agaradhaerens]UJW57831.1 class I SAM-dependent methyltransferase [Bacillus sp. A116_S68]